MLSLFIRHHPSVLLESNSTVIRFEDEDGDSSDQRVSDSRRPSLLYHEIQGMRFHIYWNLPATT